MGDPNYKGQFLEHVDMEIARQSKMDEWDWVMQSIECQVDNIILKETVKSLCNIILSHEERLDKIENSLLVND